MKAKINDPEAKRVEICAAEERRDRYKREAAMYYARLLREMIVSEDDFDVTHLLRRKQRSMEYADRRFAEYMEYINETYV